MKRPTLIDRVSEAAKVHAGPCVKARGRKPFKPCSRLAAMLVIQAENPKAPGITAGFGLDVKKGEWSDWIVYYPPKQRQFAEVKFCPFCGQAIR